MEPLNDEDIPKEQELTKEEIQKSDDLKEFEKLYQADQEDYDTLEVDF